MTGTEKTLPLFGETVTVGTRKVVTGRVKVRVSPGTHDQTVPVTLNEQTVSVEHVPVGRFVDALPPTRVEGETTIIPVVEERAVVSVRLFLREEVHVRAVRTTATVEAAVTLRQETADVERETIQPGDTP